MDSHKQAAPFLKDEKIIRELPDFKQATGPELLTESGD